MACPWLQDLEEKKNGKKLYDAKKNALKTFMACPWLRDLKKQGKF
jgi:hypothetical protein